MRPVPLPATPPVATPRPIVYVTFGTFFSTNLEPFRVVLDALQENYPAFEGKAADLLFVSRMGLSTALLISSGAEVKFDRAARVIARVNLSESAEARRRQALVADIRCQIASALETRHPAQRIPAAVALPTLTEPHHARELAFETS